MNLKRFFEMPRLMGTVIFSMFEFSLIVIANHLWITRTQDMAIFFLANFSVLNATIFLWLVDNFCTRAEKSKHYVTHVEEDK